MNAEKLGEIYKENSPNATLTLLSKFNLMKYFESVKNAFLNFTWIIYLLIFQILLSSLMLMRWKSAQKYLVFSVFFGTSISMIIYILSNNYHIPERITFSMLGLTSIVLLVFFNSIKVSAANFEFKFLTFILILFSVFSYSYLMRFNTELNARQNLYKDRNEVANKQSLSLGSLESDVVVISGASSLRFDWINPYNKFISIDPRDRTLILGWHNLSPVWNKKVKDLGLDKSNIHENLVDNNVYWASKTESELDIQDYWSNKSGKIQVTKISEIGNSEYGLYKITKLN